MMDFLSNRLGSYIGVRFLIFTTSFPDIASKMEVLDREVVVSANGP
jgi:hypothetical protein